MRVSGAAVRKKRDTSIGVDGGGALGTTPDPAALLAWYDRHRRRLPWRAAPGERADAYRVWLSEIMLQQTTVKAVAPYYLRFLERWPNVHTLAAAPIEDVLKAWALGARGTMVGRAMVYGLGAMGEAGVTKMLQMLHKELDVSMAFCGHRELTNVTRDILVPGTYPKV